MSKVLIHTIAFSPDCVSTAYLYNDIALKLRDGGYEVVVLTTTPHYNIVKEEIKKQPLKKNLFDLYYRSDYHGICVKHVLQKKYKNIILRIISFIYWHIFSFFIALFEKNVDLIISPSPPLTIGVINIILGKVKKAKVIYNVQEIYPDLLIEEKGLKSKLLIYLLKGIEKLVYNSSDRITTIDQIFYNCIVDRIKDRKKLCIIPNFVDTSLYYPISDIKVNGGYFPKTNALKLMYAGNIGYAQDWDTLISVAFSLKQYDIEYFVIGEGVKKEYLQSEVNRHGLYKIHILPYQPRSLMPHLIAYADIQFIFMSRNSEKQGFPSKIYTVMACAKPLLVCSGENTPVINFLADKQCAFLINEAGIEDKIKKVTNILTSIDRNILSEMGKNGFNMVRENYTKEVVTQLYSDIIGELV